MSVGLKVERERVSEREREVILNIQIHKHVHREYGQRDTLLKRLKTHPVSVGR
jgi:hypothetical protein